VSKMSKMWLGAVLEEHLLVAVFLYNLALVKGAEWCIGRGLLATGVGR